MYVLCRSFCALMASNPNKNHSDSKDCEEGSGEFRTYTPVLSSKTPRYIHAALPAGSLLDPSTLFSRISIWEASDEVPDPDDIRARDEGFMEDTSLEEDEGDEQAMGPVVSLQGKGAYTQIYALLQV